MRRGPLPRRLTAAVAVCVLLASGCGGPDDRLVVLVAASLTDVAHELFDVRDGTAVVSEGGSQVLAAQIRAGAPADLLLSADPDIAGELARRGLAGAPVPVARNGLAVVTVAGGGIDSPADLARARPRVVLADAAVPLGRYTREALDRLERTGAVPPGTARAVLEGADSLEDDARTVLAKVTAGEADAGIVYATDAQAARRAGADVTVVPWPPGADVTVTYTAQAVADAPNPAAAEDLLRFLRSPQAAEIWRRHGFEPVGER